MLHYTDVLYAMHSQNEAREKFLAKFESKKLSPLSPHKCVLCGKRVVRNHYRSGKAFMCLACYNEQIAIIGAFRDMLNKFSHKEDII